MNYKFTNKEFADSVERHRSMLLDVESTLDDLSIARAGLESVINNCESLADKAKLMKDAASLASLITKTTKEVVELKFKMNELIGKETLLRIADQLGKTIANTVLEFTDEETQAKVIDALAPKVQTIVMEAAN